MTLKEEAARLQAHFNVPRSRSIEINRELLEGLTPAKQKKGLAQLKALDDLKKASPLHFYNPFENPKQHAFHKMRTREKAFLGGTQSGKTTALVVDCLINAQDVDSLPEHLKPYKRHYGPFRCRIGGQGREEIEDFIFEKIQDWVTPDQLQGGSWGAAYDSVHHVLSFKNGSFFGFKTYEQENNKWGGASLDRVALDEEPPKDKLTESRFRVAARTGDILYAMTPVNGITHMFDEFEGHIDHADKSGEGFHEDEFLGLVLVGMDENPWLGTAEKAAALRGLSEQEQTTRREGRFMALHGLIYADFDVDYHVIDAPAEETIPENANVVVGIDTGWAEDAGCAVVWAYLTGDDKLVVFHELLWHSSTIAQICDEIHRQNARFNCQPIYYVIDPVARNHQSQTGRSDQMVFADHGVVCIAGQNAVDHGIVMTRERLRGEAGELRVWDTCTGLIREFRMYRWKNPPRTGEDGRPKPYKKHDHRLDALRYLITARPYLPVDEPKDDRSPNERALAEHRDSFWKPPVSVA